ncbi:6-hydroxymethylpterin diphosphokinase MptE-like protein [Thermoplasma sp.]|uniref:6-hydroxymethylpterin diphosphokinase MptE-like protein n=1 Tax=Thermoplasma sp. TaxID=1973142 RepID=UPI00126EF8B3|nr:6-hydroxymethylpterin diphosphokinase MptE-like protein [Thermoplasma sp.]KAA8922146.1 MAG: DUF115 domain-containing protein [Thermoplasma sp.]
MMDLARWMSIYGSITDDFGFYPCMDHRSSMILSNFVGDPDLPVKRGRTAYVIGNGPAIREAVPSISGGYSIVADSAILAYWSIRGCPDMIVTDLDGDLESIFECAHQGSTIVIHGHGDNIHRIIENRERISRAMVGTTQNLPFRNVANFFGFTDGDRAAYIAHRMGFERIVLVSFDFHHVNRTKQGSAAMKAKKLKWAEALLAMLAADRGSPMGVGDFIEI